MYPNIQAIIGSSSSTTDKVSATMPTPTSEEALQMETTDNPVTGDQQQRAPTTDSTNVMEDWENGDITLCRFKSRLESQEFIGLLEKFRVKKPSTLQVAATLTELSLQKQTQDPQATVPPMTQTSELSGSSTNQSSTSTATEDIHLPTTTSRWWQKIIRRLG